MMTWKTLPYFSWCWKRHYRHLYYTVYYMLANRCREARIMVSRPWCWKRRYRHIGYYVVGSRCREALMGIASSPWCPHLNRKWPMRHLARIKSVWIKWRGLLADYWSSNMRLNCITVAIWSGLALHHYISQEINILGLSCSDPPG